MLSTTTALGPGRATGSLALLLVLVSSVWSEPEAFHVSGDSAELPSVPLSTRTVFGFLDFVTTVSDTVMIFTSQGGPGNSPVHSKIPLNKKLQNLNIEPTAALELESIFNSMEQEKKHQPFIEVTSSREDAAAASGEIQPSAVRATEKDEGTTHSGDVELHNTVAADTDLAGGSTEDSSKVQNNDDDSEQKRNLSEARESINTLRGRVRTGARRQASSDYKERLRKRMEKEKKKLALKELVRKSKQTSQRRSFGQSKENDIYYVDEETESQTSSPVRFKSRSSRTRSKTRARSLEIDEVFKEQEISEGFGRSYGSKNKARPVRQRPSPRRNKISESSTDSTESRPTRFKPRRPSFSTRNRFKSRNDERIQPALSTPATTLKPTQTKNTASAPTKSVTDSSAKPKIVFKKFNRFERPDLRKSLRNKFFAKRPDLKRPEVKKPEPEEKSTKEIEEIEKQSEADDLAIPGDNDSAQSALVPSIIDDENILQNLENEEIRLERLLTTLEVSTLHPQEMSEEYLEVATIRSPYTFNIEDNQKSTRFITITKTNTRSSEINPSNSFTSTFPSGSVRPSPTIRPSTPVSSTPLFDIASIPAPENILASSEAPPYEAVLQGSSDVEFLAPLTLTSSLHQATPPLKTVTESLSTVETVVKRSILPVVWGAESSLYTLSQTYTITKVVTAVKTVPPMELYEFSPEHSFADFDTLFEEAGSENRESLLPGELEFSDQDNFGLEGPSLIRVEPPEEFLEDFDLIGTKFDHTEKNNEDKVESFVPVESQPTPSLPELGLAGLGVTPEQLLYLQLLQNPLAALGIGGGLGKQVVTESSPVYKTEPVVQTSVIKLFLGAKEIFTTLSQTVGLTTRTDYVYSTRTVGGGLGGLAGALGGLGQLGGQQVTAEPAVGLAGLVPSFTLVSSPVTRNTVITQTVTEQYKIRFRNQPTLTTVTSTKLVSTQVTSFVTKTQRVRATANPLAGLLG